MATSFKDSTSLFDALCKLAETLQNNPIGASAVVTLAFFALVAWVVYKLFK